MHCDNAQFPIKAFKFSKNCAARFERGNRDNAMVANANSIGNQYGIAVPTYSVRFGYKWNCLIMAFMNQ